MRIKFSQTLIKQSLRYTLYFSMIFYFEKTLRNVVQDIRFASFFFSFYLTNYLALVFTEFVSYGCYYYCYCYLNLFCSLLTKTINLCNNHCSSSWEKRSFEIVIIMKVKISNSLKSSLMQTWSAFNMFLVLSEKVKYNLFSVKFSIKICRYVLYGYDPWFCWFLRC